MQFGGAQICFEHTSGQLAAQPVIVERRDGYRCLVLQDVPLFELPDVEADEVVVQRCAFNARGGMALPDGWVALLAVCASADVLSRAVASTCAVG